MKNYQTNNKGVLKLAKDLNVNEVLSINNKFGYTDLLPLGNLIINKTIQNDLVIITISGWDGDFELEYNLNDIVKVEEEII